MILNRNLRKLTSQTQLFTAGFVCVACATSSMIYADTTWEESQKLKADVQTVGDDFGQSIAISGNVAVLGAPGDDSAAGSAFVFDVTTGQRLFKLQADDRENDDRFGTSVAVDGTFAVIGAVGDDDNGSNAGAAYVFDVTTGQQLFKLLPNDGLADAFFGYSVSVSGSKAIVGVDEWETFSFKGSGYVFDIATGTQLLKLTANDGTIGDRFAASVGLEGNRAVIGSSSDDDGGGNAGAVYVFDATTGQQTMKLLADDGAVGDYFGFSVATHDGLAVVGAYGKDDWTGAAYVFDTSTGQQLSKLQSEDAALFDRFGGSVSIHGSSALVGAIGHQDTVSLTSAAYLFDATTGQQQFEFLPSDGSSGDQFGASVAIGDDVAVIGAPRQLFAGAAYVFEATASDCLNLDVANLVAGQNAVFTITGGTTGSKGVTVYGTKSGQTVVNNISGYCATFAIKGVSQDKVLGGLNRTFDATGEITFNQFIPSGAAGANVLFQSAMQGTCPDKCVSNVVELTVQ